MTFHARHCVSLLAMLFVLVGCAAHVNNTDPPVVVATGPACQPEFVIREPDTEDQSNIYHAEWCGGDALVYTTSLEHLKDNLPFVVRVDLKTGEHKRIVEGRYPLRGMEEIETAVGPFECSPDGDWLFYGTAANRVVGFSIRDGRKATIPTPAYAAIPSPDGSKLALGIIRDGKKRTDPPVAEEMALLLSAWELVYLPRRLAFRRSAYPWDSSLVWLPDSRSLLVVEFVTSEYRLQDGLYTLDPPLNRFTKLRDVGSADDLASYPESVDWVKFFEFRGVAGEATTSLVSCRIVAERRFCETVARIPHPHQLEFPRVVGRARVVAAPDDNTIYYDTGIANSENPVMPDQGAVYRYDIATGQSFQIARGQLMGGLSPDGKRLIYRSEPFTLNVLNLDDPETRRCGTPVEAGKK